MRNAAERLTSLYRRLAKVRTEGCPQPAAEQQTATRNVVVIFFSLTPHSHSHSCAHFVFTRLDIEW